MKRIVLLTIICITTLIGCAKKNEQTPESITNTSPSTEEVTIDSVEDDSNVIESVVEETSRILEDEIKEKEMVHYTDEELKDMTPEELFEAFCQGEIKAGYYDEFGKISDYDSSHLQFGDDDFDACSHVEIVEPVDLDNDGELEYILNNVVYGDMCFDCKNGKVILFAKGEGTAQYCSYYKYKGAMWISHKDTTHGGRCCYWFDKYNGDLEIVDSFKFGWFADDYNEENKEFYYNDKTISEKEYDALLEEIRAENE